MAERIAVMKKACHEHGLDKPGEDQLHKPYPWEYFIAPKQKLIWCNVFKSASSSWMYVFNKLAGYSDTQLKSRQPPISMARLKYSRPSVQELLSALDQKDSIGFIIARHPFQRLVSAYKDKIVGAIPGTPHSKLCQDILVKYRKISRKAVQAQTGQRRSRYWQGSRNPKMVPTFKEFVSYIIDEAMAGHSLDMHWTPVYSFCNPCQVNLNHIVKFETFNRDSDYIVKAVGIQNVLNKFKGSLSHENKSRKDKHKPAMEYVNELTQDQLVELTKLYQPDFDIFGYKAEIIPSPAA